MLDGEARIDDEMDSNDESDKDLREAIRRSLDDDSALAEARRFVMAADTSPRTPTQPLRTSDQPRRTPQRVAFGSHAAATGRSPSSSEGAAVTAETAVAALQEELRALPVAELRRRCAGYDVSTHGLLEKEEFVTALLAAHEEPAARTSKGQRVAGDVEAAAEVRVRRISKAANLDVEL